MYIHKNIATAVFYLHKFFIQEDRKMGQMEKSIHS